MITCISVCSDDKWSFRLMVGQLTGEKTAGTSQRFILCLVLDSSLSDIVWEDWSHLGLGEWHKTHCCKKRKALN